MSESWIPEGIDVDQPSSARIYDYYLGGAHNFEADRRVAEQTLAIVPDGPRAAYANRAFLRRAVSYLAGAGVRQFLDIGSGIPTVGHVHEVAQQRAPESRVVFVDNDPVAVAHGREILAGNPRTAVVHEDAREPERILAAPELRALLDLDQPVAVLVVALFHFMTDADDPAGLLARLTTPLAPGSHLVLSHGTDDGEQDMGRIRDIYRRSGIELTWRTRAEVAALFDGWELLDPGVVWVPQWRPESADDPYSDRPEMSGIYAGVGRKP